jgi:hypothetical protein
MVADPYRSGDEPGHRGRAHPTTSPRFFAYKCGISWLNAVNDRFAATSCRRRMAIRPTLPELTEAAGAGCLGEQVHPRRRP